MNKAGGFTMREKRILMTWIFGAAWDTFCTKKYDHMRRSAFLKTGALLTMTGKNDKMVQAPLRI